MRYYLSPSKQPYRLNGNVLEAWHVKPGWFNSCCDLNWTGDASFKGSNILVVIWRIFYMSYRELGYLSYAFYNLKEKLK